MLSKLSFAKWCAIDQIELGGVGLNGSVWYPGRVAFQSKFTILDFAQYRYFIFVLNSILCSMSFVLGQRHLWTLALVV
jgi:hypothetical protein